MTTKDTAAIVRDEHAQLDYTNSMSYGDYLHIDQVLSAQHPLRPHTTRCCSSSSTRPASCG
jgi:tryptophan 2,3-dioxygenase